MSKPEEQETKQDDWVVELAKVGAIVVGVVVGLVLLTPLVIPLIALRSFNDRIATKWRYWVVLPFGWAINLVCIALVGVLAAVEVHKAIRWQIEGTWAHFVSQPNVWELVLPTFGPWLLLNFVAGVLLLPPAWSWHRRALLRKVRLRQIANVTRQDDIERARLVADDETIARKIGVKVNRSTGKIVGLSKNVVYAPKEIKGRQVIGYVLKPTVRNSIERFHDLRQVPDWIDQTGTYFTLPLSPAAQRAIVLAESGSGKTVFLFDVILAALRLKQQIVFIDGKGDPGDAARLAELVRSFGGTAAVQPLWDFFNGDAEQVTEKLMRLLPPPDGANQHYLNQARLALQLIQRKTPIKSITDLKSRMENPAPHVSDQSELKILRTPVGAGKDAETIGTRALLDLLAGINPLERFLSDDGWAYTALQADVTIVSVTPTIDSEARYGDLLLADLSHYLVHRNKAGERSPLLTIVDEFPQLVAGGADPSDKAASLLETARSTGMGLILASQGTAGLSKDETSRERILTSGAAIIAGRMKSPEEAVKYAGTTIRMESSGAAVGEELKSGRSQHTFALAPNTLRLAADAQMWIMQGGAVGSFRVLPTGKGDVRQGVPTGEAPAAESIDNEIGATPPLTDAGVQFVPAEADRE